MELLITVHVDQSEWKRMKQIKESKHKHTNSPGRYLSSGFVSGTVLTEVLPKGVSVLAADLFVAKQKFNVQEVNIQVHMYMYIVPLHSTC